MNREKMQREVNPVVFAVVIAVLVIGAGYFVWRASDSPLNSPGAGEAAYRQAEDLVRKQGKDPKAFFGKEYYRYHPDEMKNLRGNVSGLPVGSPNVLPGMDAPGHWQGQGQRQGR